MWMIVGGGGQKKEDEKRDEDEDGTCILGCREALNEFISKHQLE